MEKNKSSMWHKINKKDKKGLVWSEIAWWVIGLGVLALVIILLFFIQKRGINLLEEIKNFFRFSR